MDAGSRRRRAKSRQQHLIPCRAATKESPGAAASGAGSEVRIQTGGCLPGGGHLSEPPLLRCGPKDLRLENQSRAVTKANGDQLAFPPGYDDALRQAGKRAGAAPPAMPGMAWVDHQFKFGPPKYTYRVDILPDIVRQMVMDYAIKAAGRGAQYCQLGPTNHHELKPQEPNSSDFPDWRDQRQAMAKYRNELEEWAREGREIGNKWLEDKGTPR